MTISIKKMENESRRLQESKDTTNLQFLESIVWLSIGTICLLLVLCIVCKQSNRIKPMRSVYLQIELYHVFYLVTVLTRFAA